MDCEKVLIIDQNPVTAAILEDILSPQFSVKIAHNKIDALETLSKDHYEFQVLLLDFDQPNAEDTLEAINHLTPFPDIILLSEKNDIQSIISSMKKGAFDYLIKPLDDENLRLVVSQTFQNFDYFKKMKSIIHRQEVTNVDMDYRLAKSQEYLWNKQIGGQNVEVEDFSQFFPPPDKRGFVAPITLKNHIENELGQKASIPTEMIRLLIVEDEAVMRDNLTLFLKEKFQVHAVGTGTEAIEYLQVHSDCHLVLLDIGLPDMSGLDVIESLKKTGRQETLSIIVVTAFSDRDTAVKSLRHGVDDFIVKPFLKKDLLKKIEDVLENRHLENALPELRDLFRSRQLSFNNRLHKFEEMIHKRLSENEKIYMRDLYVFFPECRHIKFPDAKVIPETTIQTGLTEFIKKLKTTQQDPDTF